MRRGKEIAQGAHASQLALEAANEIIGSERVAYWKGTDRMRKVCVQVGSLEELKTVYEQAVAAGLPCALVVDDGLTEFRNVQTETAVGIGPADDETIDTVTRKLKLY